MHANLTIPCDAGEVSDGYHTFNELYDHRHALFIALMVVLRSSAWYSEVHNDGSKMDGWFVAGIKLATGDITYHLPISKMKVLEDNGIPKLGVAPPWDGHTPKDVVDRLNRWVEK